MISVANFSAVCPTGFVSVAALSHASLNDYQQSNDGGLEENSVYIIIVRTYKNVPNSARLWYNISIQSICCDLWESW